MDRTAAATPQADTVVLSETTDGDYLVRRFIVRRQDDSDYSVRYQINLARLSSSFDDNSRELDALNGFVENLMRDSLMHVRSVVITGYSSPDGPLPYNEKLAADRARDFRDYLDGKYDFSRKFDVQVRSVAEDWEMCRALVAKSSVPDKQQVLSILDGARSDNAKEAALKKLPAAWQYMRRNILPPLRRVELEIVYGEGRVVEQRTMIRKPEPPCPPAPACPYEVIDETITGIIFAMPESETTDYEKVLREERREIARESREAARMARREAREAERIARREARAVRKSGTRERKTYRELEAM